MIRKLSIFLLLIFLSGCWGKIELPEVSIVSGVSIDKKASGEFEVTIQKIKPLAVSEHEPKPFLTRSSSGLTIFEAVRNFIFELGQKQLWSHINALIISSEVTENDLLTVTDFLNRDHEPRPNMLCLISYGQAKDFLEIESEIEPISAIAIKDALENQENLSMAPHIDLKTLLRLIAEPHQDPYLPIIKKKDDYFTILGTAIFKEDKLIGELTPEETRSMLRVLGEVKGGLQVINLAQENEEQPHYASIEIKKSQSDIEVKIEENKPKIKINIKEEGVIGDINQPLEINYHALKEIETIYAETIKAEIEQMIDKIQKQYKSNTLNFAGAVRRADSQYWKKYQEQWEEIYPMLAVEIDVETEIVHTQLKKNPISLSKKGA